MTSGIGRVQQMMKTAKLYLIKRNGAVSRTVIIVDEPFDIQKKFSQDEIDNSDDFWFSDFQGIPEC